MENSQNKGPDYDAFDLLSTITAAYGGSGTTNLFPLLYEGIGSSTVPPAGFIVVAPYNYHLGLDNLNIVNNTADAATVTIQLYTYTSGKGTPYGTAGAVILTQIVAAGTQVTLDETRFRLSLGTGYFFVTYATGSGISTTATVQVQARGRWTKG